MKADACDARSQRQRVADIAGRSDAMAVIGRAMQARGQRLRGDGNRQDHDLVVKRAPVMLDRAIRQGRAG